MSVPEGPIVVEILALRGLAPRSAARLNDEPALALEL